jgi:hypothetical protein
MLPSPITRSRHAFRALLCLLALHAAPASAQTVPAVPGEPAPSPATPVATPGAEERAAALGEQALDRAARFQRGDTPRRPPSSLHGKFHVSLRQEDGSLAKVAAERWFRLEPEGMLTHQAELVTGKSALVGWNGSRAWRRDDAGKQLFVYTDDPEVYLVDLELLQEQLRLTRLLLTASVMDALRPRLTHVTAAGTREVTDLEGSRHATDLVIARVPDELFLPQAGGPPPLPGSGPRELELRFAIDRETGALWELHVSAPGRGDVAPMLLRFDYHGPTASGLRVPGNIRVFRGGETQESVSLGVEQPGELLLFDVDVPIDAALFEPPAD